MTVGARRLHEGMDESKTRQQKRNEGCDALRRGASATQVWMPETRGRGMLLVATRRNTNAAP